VILSAFYQRVSRSFFKFPPKKIIFFAFFLKRPVFPPLTEADRGKIPPENSAGKFRDFRRFSLTRPAIGGYSERVIEHMVTGEYSKILP
jgi:hypothetical protein